MSTEKSSPPPPYYPPVDEGLGQPPKNEGYPPPAGFQYPQPQGGQPQPQTYPQPQHGGGGAGQPVHVTVVTTAAANNCTRSPVSCQAYCQKCQETVFTQCDQESSSISWLICVLLFVTGFCFLIPWFFCWVPFCVDSLNNVTHRCPKCRTTLGTYMRGGF